MILGWGWLSWFNVEMSIFKCSLYGLSVRNALAKTELKLGSKTRFYVWKRKNAILLYWWGDMIVCLDDATVSWSPVRVDVTVSWSLVRVDATVCPDDATVSVLQNPKLNFSCFYELLSMSMDFKHITLFNQCTVLSLLAPVVFALSLMALFCFIFPSIPIIYAGCFNWLIFDWKIDRWRKMLLSRLIYYI